MGLATAPAIRRGDHACCVFGSDADQTELVTRFARDALARGDRLFYLADRSDEARVLEMLDAGGIRSRIHLDAGGLQLAHSSQMTLDGGFDRERQVAAWQTLTAEARDAGYAGLAVLAEMTWAQTWNVGMDALIDYERAAADAFASHEMSALCQYDARRFDADVITSVVHSHSYAFDVRDGWCAEWSRLHVDRRGDSRVLTVGGDIDLANIEFLEYQLTELLLDGDAAVDLAHVEFIDLAGSRLLRQAARGELGAGRLELRNPPEILTRVLNLCSWADVAA